MLRHNFGFGRACCRCSCHCTSNRFDIGYTDVLDLNSRVAQADAIVNLFVVIKFTPNICGFESASYRDICRCKRIFPDSVYTKVLGLDAHVSEAHAIITVLCLIHCTFGLWFWTRMLQMHMPL